jgi:hypothetical protein
VVTAVYERFVRPSGAGTGEVTDTGIDQLFIKAAEYYFRFKWDANG